MTEKHVSPLLKTGLELGPIVLFFIAYFKLKDRVFPINGVDYDGFIVVTAGFVPLIVLATVVLWRLTGHLSKMQIATVILVVVFGGLSVWFNDERFFKMKPTMIYLLFGGALGVGLLRGQSYLKYMIEDMMPLRDEGWMALTKRLCGFFLGLAALNEVIWRSQSTDTWVYFKTFGLTAAVFVFFMTQGGLLQKYALEDDAPET